MQFKKWLISEEKNLDEAWYHSLLPALSLATSQQPAEKPVSDKPTPTYIYGDERKPENPDELKRFNLINKLTGQNAQKIKNVIFDEPGIVEKSLKSRKDILDALDQAYGELIDKNQENFENEHDPDRKQGYDTNINNIKNWHHIIKNKLLEIEREDSNIWTKLQTISDHITDETGRPVISQRMKAKGFEYASPTEFLIMMMNKNVKRKDMWVIEFNPAVDFQPNQFDAGIGEEGRGRSIFSKNQPAQIVDEVTQLYELVLGDEEAKKPS